MIQSEGKWGIRCGCGRSYIAQAANIHHFEFLLSNMQGWRQTTDGKWKCSECTRKRVVYGEN